MILLAFHISYLLNTKRHAGSEKTYSNFIQNFYFINSPIRIKVFCNGCITNQLNKLYPHKKQIAEKQVFEGQIYTLPTEYHSTQKDHYHPLRKETHIQMVICDAFTHYAALNPVPHCNAFYAYTTLYEHWIAKIGLPEIVVTDNGTEYINNEMITLFHL